MHPLNMKFETKKINRTKVKTISNYYMLLYYNTVLHTRNALLLKLTEEYFLINLYHVHQREVMSVNNSFCLECVNAIQYRSSTRRKITNWLVKQCFFFMDLEGTFEINQIPVRLTNKWGKSSIVTMRWRLTITSQNNEITSLCASKCQFECTQVRIRGTLLIFFSHLIKANVKP